MFKDQIFILFELTGAYLHGAARLAKHVASVMEPDEEVKTNECLLWI